MAEDHAEGVLQLVGDGVDELATVLVEPLELHDELLLPLVGPRAEQRPAHVATDPERSLALALRPAVLAAVADHDQRAHRLVPGAHSDEQQLAGGVRGEVVGQGLAMVAVQLVVAPHPIRLGDDHRPGHRRPARRGLDRGIEGGWQVGGGADAVRTAFVCR